MPWSTSDRKSQLPADWEQIRKRVGDRDGWKCQMPRASRGGRICGQPARDCDHRDDPHDHRDSALWMLCRFHHTGKTQQESADARRAILGKLSHPVEQTPMRRA